MTSVQKGYSYAKWTNDEVTVTICNVPIHTVDITNLQPKCADSNELVIVKLKQKLESRSYVFFESVRPTFLNKF